MQNRPSFSTKLASWITNNPWKSLSFILILAVIILPGLAKFNVQNDVRVWFRSDDPNIEVLNAFERQFGNDESIVIALHSKNGLFDLESMQAIEKLTEKMWIVPQVIRVESLTNFNETTTIEDDIVVDAFISPDRSQWTQDYLNTKKTDALKSRQIPGYLINEAADTALIFARLIPTLKGSPNYKKIVEESRKIVAPFQGKSDHIIYVTGQATMNNAFREVSKKDMALILPVLILLVLVQLFFVFRSISGMVLPIIVTILSVLLPLGVGFHFGTKFNSILSIMPAILTAISIADSVHVLVTYFQFRAIGESGKEAIFHSLQKNIVPTLLTSLSTMIGFLSLGLADLVPIQRLGVLSGLGCAFAWIITVFFLGGFFTLVELKPSKLFLKAFQKKKNSSISTKAFQLINNHRGKIVISFSFLTVLSIYLGSLNQINSNPYDYFKKGTPIRESQDFLMESYGGIAGPEFVIRAEGEDKIKEPTFLQKVDEFKTWVNSHPKVNATVDIIDVIKEMNQALGEGKPEAYAIPKTQKAVAEELFLYSMSLPQGMDLNNRVTLKNDAIRMSVLWSITDSKKWGETVTLMEDKAKSMGLNLSTTGKTNLFQQMMGYVVKTFFQSIVAASILVAFLMMILFKSPSIGFISLLPNMIPLCIGAAFMYMIGIPLNIGSSLVASVCIGIAVDDTIHFLSNFFRLRKEGKNMEQTMVEIFDYTGSALIITTSILVSGFGLYMFGAFIPNVHFGILCALVLVTALIVDLVFLPALLLCFKRPQKRG